MIALVTGASGFVGRHVCARLVEGGQFRVRGASRQPASLPAGVEKFRVSDVGADTDWTATLAGVSVIVHLAARVHVVRDSSASPLNEFRRVNVAGTERLLQQAVGSGVRRVVYISSLKVNGESGSYSESDRPSPEGPYAVSKYEAEQVVRTFADRIETVIVRPPLVYGPGVRANFHRLLRAVTRGVPLPLGSVRNQRSLVGLDNLVDFIVTCMVHPAAAGETFLVSDGDDLSTAELIRRIARAFGRSPRLLPIPEALLFAAAGLVGQRATACKILGSLRVDTSKARRVLGWVPPSSVDEELSRMAQSGVIS